MNGGVIWCFKPYYKWITFNIMKKIMDYVNQQHSFKPYYKWITFNMEKAYKMASDAGSFKPYYKWITFNM